MFFVEALAPAVGSQNRRALPLDSLITQQFLPEAYNPRINKAFPRESCDLYQIRCRGKKPIPHVKWLSQNIVAGRSWFRKIAHESWPQSMDLLTKVRLSGSHLTRLAADVNCTRMLTATRVPCLQVVGAPLGPFVETQEATAQFLSILP